MIELDKLREAVDVYIHIGIPLTTEELNAIEVLRSFSQSVLDAKDMPQEKQAGKSNPEHINNHCFGENDCPECNRNYGYNEGRSEMLAYHLNKVAKLEYALHIASDVEHNTIVQLNSEVYRLREDNTSYKNIISALNDEIDRLKKGLRE